MCMMAHSSDQYGYLTDHGTPLTAEDIAAYTQLPLPVVKKAIDLLGERDVYGKTESGIIYSRKLVRMAAKSEARSKAGRKGAENRWEGKQEDDDSDMANAIAKGIANGIAQISRSPDLHSTISSEARSQIEDKNAEPPVQPPPDQQLELVHSEKKGNGKKAPSTHQVLYDAYNKLMVQYHGRGPVTGDNSVNANVCRKVIAESGGLEEALELLKLYVQDDDPWVVKHGWGFRWFHNQLPGLIQKRARKTLEGGSYAAIGIKDCHSDQRSQDESDNQLDAWERRGGWDDE